MSRIRLAIRVVLLFVLVVSSLSFAQEGTVEEGEITIPALGGITKATPKEYSTGDSWSY